MHPLIILAFICGLALAAPQGIFGFIGALTSLIDSIPFLVADPPAFLQTQNSSPQCASINHGALLCCQSIINGDMPLVVELAQLAGNFRLNPNSINGLYCNQTFTTCNSGVKLCCEVDDLVNPPVINNVLSLALYCQEAPTQDSPTCSK